MTAAACHINILCIGQIKDGQAMAALLLLCNLNPLAQSWAMTRAPCRARMPSGHPGYVDHHPEDQNDGIRSLSIAVCR